MHSCGHPALAQGDKASSRSAVIFTESPGLSHSNRGPDARKGKRKRLQTVLGCTSRRQARLHSPSEAEVLLLLLVKAPRGGHHVHRRPLTTVCDTSQSTTVCTTLRAAEVQRRSWQEEALS